MIESDRILYISILCIKYILYTINIYIYRIIYLWSILEMKINTKIGIICKNIN